MSASYYVRARGRISGPFDSSTLQRMARRGMLSRVHEVSTDKLKWTSAAELADVFQVASSSLAAEVAEVAAPANGGDPAVGTPLPPQSASSGATYYYSQAGSTIGPLSLPVLKALAQNGTLGPADVVWREDAEVATPACQLTQLAGIFGQTPARRSAAGGVAASNLAAFVKLREQVRDMTTTMGFVMGGAILLLVNLPLLQIGNRSLFWWHIAGRGAEGFTISVFYILLVAVTLCIIAALLHGKARAVVYMSLAGFGLLIWAFSPFAATGPAPALIMVAALLLIPPLTAISLASARFRAVCPEYAPGRVLLTVVGSVMALLSFIASLILLSEMPGGWSVIPGWATAVLMLVVLSCLCALATGILGIVNVKPQFSPGLNTTILVLSLVTLLSSILYSAIMVVGATDMAGVGRELVQGFAGSSADLPSSAAMGFLLFRIIFVFYALVALLSTGLLELLISMVDRPTTSHARVASL